MYLMQGVPAFNPETTTAGARAASALLSNLFQGPMTQAQLSQQQTAAQYAPAAAQADIATKEALAQMYGGKNDYYTGGANLKNTQAGAITTGGNTPVANAMRFLQAANQSGDPNQIQAAYYNLNNVLNLQRSEISKNNATAQNQQAAGAYKSTQAVNQGSPGGYTSPQLPGMVPNSGSSISTQSTMPTVTTTTTAPDNSQYANQMTDTGIVGAVMNNNLPPLQPVGPGRGIALKNQSVNALKQMDSLQTFPSKIQAVADYYSNPDVQAYVGPTFSKGGAARGIGDVLNSVGLAPSGYNQSQTGSTASLISGEGLSQLAVPGTRSGSLILKNIAQLDPTKVKNAQAAQQQVNEIVKANIQDLTGYIKGNYLPSVRQSAMLQLQAAMKYPVYQQAYAELQQQENPKAATNSAAVSSGKVLSYDPTTGMVH